MTIRAGPGESTLSLEGVFDLAESERVLLATRALAGDRLAVDFRGLREIHDSALAALVTGLGPLGQRVELRGLPGHQRRMLDYLGDHPSTPGALGGILDDRA